MTKQELLRALAPFDDDTFIDVTIMTTDGQPFELNIAEVKYMPSIGEAPAYLTLRTQQ